MNRPPRRPSSPSLVLMNRRGQRPLQIAVLEDKIVQQVGVTILTQTYEEDFRGLGERNNFKPNRLEDAKMSWKEFELAPTNAAFNSSKVTSVSRIHNSMEIWWIGANGSVQDAYWYDGGKWGRFELAPADSAAPNGGITAVSRIPGSMEVWWIGANGSVQGAFWYEGGQWGRYELAPAGSASTSGGIKAVSGIPTSMEVWWIGANGSVQDAYWYDGGKWGRFELAPAGSAATSGGIKAVSRIPTSMEVWWIGANGSVQDAYWYDGGKWGRFELAPAGSAAASGGITRYHVSLISMEVWWIGANGSVQDACWYDGGSMADDSSWPQPAVPQLIGGITAVSRIPNSMEVWWVGANGSVQDAYWYDNAQWQRFELAPAGSAAPNGGITAVSRIPGSMEVWWIGADSSIQDAYWYDQNIPTILDFDFNPIVFGGGVPVGGSSHLTIRQDGSFTFSGHFHDSGATEYNVALVWAVKDFQNQVYTFQHAGHVSGTFESGSRDDDWRIDSRDDRIAQNWLYLTAGSNGAAKADATIDVMNLTNSLIGTLGTVLGVVAIIVA